MRKLPMLLLLGAAASLWAQGPSRDAYRQAYRTWRQADATLEHDSATAGEALAARTASAAQAAAVFTTARAAFLDEITQEARQQQLWLQNAALDPPPPLGGTAVQDVVQAASQGASGIINSFAGDTDPAIGRLRQALERERSTLGSLSEAIQRRLQAASAVTSADNTLDEARLAALSAYQNVAEGRSQGADQVRQEAAAWQKYYQLLADGARGVAVSAAAPAPAGAPVAPAAPKPFTPKPSITPVPLARYTGGWTFPANGIYKGAQPEFVDLVVHEDNGHITGELYGRFVLPAGSPGDPVLRFDFDGDLTAERTQRFTLRTTEGATGTIELIPGPAFNLLEVNFQTTPVENKVRNGNFVLLKK